MAGTYEQKPWADGVTSLQVLELDGVVATVGTPSVTIKEIDASGNVIYCLGTSVPTNGDAGYAVGCFFKNTAGGAGTTLYINEGSSTSALFDAVSSGSGGGAQTITATSANAFTVGPNGTTNPTFNVDTSTASAATGLKIKSAAAAAGLAVSVLSSGTNENLTIDAKGSGTISIGTNSTGVINTGVGIAISAASNLTAFSVNVSAASRFTLATGGGTVTLNAPNDNLIIASNAQMRIRGSTSNGVIIQDNVAVPAGGSTAASILMSSTATFVSGGVNPHIFGGMNKTGPIGPF